MFGGGLIAAALCSGGKEKIGDEWQLPKVILDMPEASKYQIILLYEVTENTINKPVLSITLMPYDYDGSENIDWGDGISTNIIQDYSYTYSHFYTATGFYIIKINCSALTKYINLNKVIGSTFITGGSFPPSGIEINFGNSPTYRENIRAIKFGENIYSDTIVEAENDFTGLIYVKYCGNSYNIAAESLGEDNLYYLRHYGCSALCRVDFDVLPEKIPQKMFYGCVALRNAPFAKNLTEIPQSAFQNCTALGSADISSAETVGAIAFQNCTSLSNLMYSDDCTFGTNCFQNCYSLYPRPDGR